MNKLTILQVIFSLISTSYATECGQTSFSFFTGSISFSTSTAISCTYNINVSNRVVELKWSLFQVPGEMPSCRTNQYLKVYLGCGLSPTYLTSFCSSNMDGLPHNIYGRDGCIKIVVKTQGSANFVASYSSKSSGSYFSYPSRCSRWKSICLKKSKKLKDNSVRLPNGRMMEISTYNKTGLLTVFPYDITKMQLEKQFTSSSKNLYGKSGVIASPGWPNYYTDDNFPSGFFSSNGECEWDIKLSSTKKLIKLSFMDVDIYSYSSSCRSDEILKVKGEKSVLTSVKEKRTYCKKKPFSLTTKYYELEIEMEIDHRRSSSSYRNRGFVVGWVSYQDDEAAERTKWGWIVGGIVMSVFFFVFLFCCIRFCKRRNSRGHVTATTVTTTTSYGSNVNQPMVQKQANYPQQGYVPTQPYSQQPGYPPQQAYPPPAYPPQQPYPPPSQPYGQNYTVPQQDKPVMTEGYPAAAPPPYPGPPNDSYNQAPSAPPSSAPYPPPQ